MTSQKATAKEVAPASRLEQLGLADLFQPGSTTRAAAELLLTGEPITRQELVRRTGVVETVVPRTINRLHKAGIYIERVQDPVTKAATYTAKIPVINHAPEGAFEFSARKNAEAVVMLESMEADLRAAHRGEASRGQTVSVRLTSPLGTVTGVVPMSPLLVQWAREGLPLSQVLLFTGGRQEWMLGHPPNTLLVSNIGYI